MEVYLISFGAFLAVIVAMAVGVIFSNRRIKGSCGGLSAWKDQLGNPMCEACAEDPEKKKACELELARLREAEEASRHDG